MNPSRPVLLIAPSLRGAWNDAIAPWFDRVLPEIWKQALPSLVVVPTRGQINDLKARLLAKGDSHLGLHFVTPASLNEILARDDEMPSADPEHLRLLLAIAASEMEDRPNEAEALAAKAVARTPGPLLRALDRLETAGWQFKELGLPSFIPTLQRFNELLKKCHFVPPGQADRRRLQQTAKNARKFSNVIITGFDGAHWPHWFLLRTAVELAENATVVLNEPGKDFAEFDLCWIGSWEEIYGEAKRASKTPLSGDALFSEAEMRGQTQAAHFDFLIGTNFAEQAQAIARQCLRYLAEEKCTRLGVIFPGSGALPRLVANALAHLDIPHNDGIAHIAPGLFESAEWEAWISLQRAPRLNSFLRFLNALPEPAIISPNLSRSAFEEILRKSYSDVLLDDLEILREFCATQTGEKYQSAATALRAFPFLPARATLAQFLEATQAALNQLGWKQHAIVIASATQTQNWPQRFAAKFSRTLFLRWLEETAATSDAARSDPGDHPYARVQLLTVAHAQNQEWSHLIFAGWNEGAWPPLPGAEFAREEEIRAFNRGIQQLNKRAAQQGSQGEGHTSVRENFSLYLGPIEQRAIALRQFDALLESASESVTLTASLLQEDAPERLWNPSESFTQLYRKTRGAALTQKTLKNLQSATALLPAPSLSTVDVQQTLIAFNARRNRTTKAGEYDFALRSDGSYHSVPALSVSNLQDMVSSPALVWMERYLGVKAPEETGDPWLAASGKWVHQWLAQLATAKADKIFTAFPNSTAIDERVRSSAGERRAILRNLCETLNKAMPDWWNSGWLNALYLARHLGGKIAREDNWKWIATEVRIGRAGAVKIADEIELHLHGQIDLVLTENDAANFAGQKIWIVDYKTGTTKELRKTDLHDNLVKGTTLQLGLYALALSALGAAEVSASILSPAVKNTGPQLSVTELAPHTNVFADLAEMQRTGVFGMKGEVRSAFGFSKPYPLATVPIDYDVLEDKWALTHPALVLEKEEWEIF